MVAQENRTGEGTAKPSQSRRHHRHRQFSRVLLMGTGDDHGHVVRNCRADAVSVRVRGSKEASTVRSQGLGDGLWHVFRWGHAGVVEASIAKPPLLPRTWPLQRAKGDVLAV